MSQSFPHDSALDSPSLHVQTDCKKWGFPYCHNSKLQSTSEKGYSELSISVSGTAVSAQFGLAKGSSGRLESTRQQQTEHQTGKAKE